MAKTKEMKRPKGIYAYRRGDTWTLRLEVGSKPDGSPKFRTFGGYESEQAAYDDAPNRIVQISTSKTVSRDDPTVWQFCKDYLDNEIGRMISKGRRANSTKVTYTSALKRIEASEIGSIKLNKLTRMDIQDWIDELDVSPGSKITYSGFLSGALKSAFKYNLIDKNPYVSIEIDQPKKKKGAYWTPEQAELFLRYNKDDFIQIAVELAVYGGMRIGEICAYTWSDYDKAKNVLHTTKTEEAGGNVKAGTKGHPEGRIIPVSDKLAEVLEVHKQKMHQLETNVIGINIKSQNILLNSNGDRLRAQHVRERFKASCEAVRACLKDEEIKTGLPSIRFHDLRHTFVSIAYDSGIPIEVIAEITGHSSKAITEVVYLHILDNKTKDAVNKVAARITNS